MIPDLSEAPWTLLSLQHMGTQSVLTNYRDAGHELQFSPRARAPGVPIVWSHWEYDFPEWMLERPIMVPLRDPFLAVISSYNRGQTLVLEELLLGLSRLFYYRHRVQAWIDVEREVSVKENAIPDGSGLKARYLAGDVDLAEVRAEFDALRGLRPVLDALYGLAGMMHLLGR